MNLTMTNQPSLYVARLHWLLFLGPIILIILAIFSAFHWVQFREVALVFLAVGLIWLLMTWLNFHFSSLTIEKNRIIFRTGILVRKTTDIPITKLESIDIRQSIIGSIMRYGRLTVTGTGGTNHTIDFVEKPLTCRRYIEQLMHQLSV